MAVKITKSKKTKPEADWPMSEVQQAELFMAAVEGDVIELPSLLAGIDSTEPVKMELIEKYEMEVGDEPPPSHRLTFRTTWHGVFLSNMVAMINPAEATVQWSGSYPEKSA